MAISANQYHKEIPKRFLDILLSVLGLIILSPLYLLIFLLLKLENKGSVFFVQERTGKNGTLFKIIKFRTMTINAHSQQKKLEKQNEADGPVFKIYNDPRFTKFGKILAHTGLDELPQLINILKGEMSFVGPRPLPVAEAKLIPQKYREIRELVKPGLTSFWVVNGSHKLTFRKWMEMDIRYVKHGNLKTYLYIIISTVGLVGKGMLQKIAKMASDK